MLLGLADSLFRLFRENSDVVPLSRLKKDGVRSVTVLDWDRVGKLIAEAVEDTLARRGLDLPSATLKSINEEAREAFLRLVEQRDTWRESAQSLEKQRAELQHNLDQLRQELSRSRGQLDREIRQPITAADVAVDRAGAEEYVRRLEGEIRAAIAEGAAADEALAARLGDTARRLLDETRSRALASAQAEQRQRIELLERRIAKLNRTLEETETVVLRLKSAKAGDPGIESIYRDVQGLDPEDRRSEAKKGLLDEVFRLNVELREVIAAAAREAGRPA